MKTLPMSSIEDLIVEYHRLYHEYGREEYREIAKRLGTIKPSPTFEEIWQKRVNEGCKKRGEEPIYKETPTLEPV